MKNKIITSLFAAIAVISISATKVNAVPHYCDTCCDTDGFGGARKRCALSVPVVCGESCTCNGAGAKLFACYGF